MSVNTLRKFVAPVITPAVGGIFAPPRLGGFPGANPQLVGGFYPTPPYAALRTFIDGEGRTQLHPADFVDYRLNSDILQASPPVPLDEAEQLIENNLRGQFDVSRPFVYLLAMFNLPPVSTVAPFPTAEVVDAILPNSWGAGAVTTNGFVDRGQFTFTVDAGTFAVVGLVPPLVDVGDPAAISFGFLIRSVAGCSSVMESGAVIPLSVPYTFTETTLFAVQYIDGALRYFIGGTLVRSSTVPVPRAPVFLRGGASLYSGGSDVTGVSIAGFSSANAVLPGLRMVRNAGIYPLPALRVSAGWLPYAALSLPRTFSVVGGKTPYAYANAVLPRIYLMEQVGRVRLGRLGLTGGTRSAGVLRLPRTALLGSNKVYGTGGGTLPVPTMRAFSGRPQVFGGMYTLPRIRAIATGGSGQLGQAAVSLPALRGRSASFSAVAAVLPRLSVLGYQDPAREAFISNALFSSDPSNSSLLLFVSLDSDGVVVSVSAVQVVDTAQLISAGVLSSTAATAAIIQALLDSALVGNSFAPAFVQGGQVEVVGPNGQPRQSSETWVLNVDTGASSTYENYAFNSFGTVGGAAYGVRSDGLYLLDGDKDAGEPIRASVSFGSTNFGTDFLKRLEHAYVGVSSSGKMHLKVILGDGTSYIYAARNNADYMAMQRIEVGRGLRASFITLEMYNSNGCDFELNSVDFQAAELSRRI